MWCICALSSAHLADPLGLVQACSSALRPGGVLIVEDIDYRGCFTWPEHPGFQRSCTLYETVVRRRGGDPHIGARLPIVLADGNFEHIGMRVVQLMATEGEIKLIHPITLQTIGDAVVQDGLLTREALDALIDELYALAGDPRSVIGLPRIVQTWGRRPAVEATRA